jgi:hypothetical protein
MASNFAQKFYDRFTPDVPTHYFSIKKFEENINEYTNLYKKYFNFINIAKYKLDVTSLYYKYNKNKYARNTKIFEDYLFYKKNKNIKNDSLLYEKKQKIKTSILDYETFHESDKFST